MSRLLIGSSNVYRFHKLIANKDFQPYKMVCCTNQDVWNVSIDDIKFEKGEVIISVIENLICDAVVGVTDPAARLITIEDVVGSFLAQIKKCAQTKPEIKFALAMPMLRPIHGWYQESHEAISGLFREGIRAMGVRNVSKIDNSPVWSQVFEVDGVHLTEMSGKVFVENLISSAEAFFTEVLIDLEEDTSQKNSDPDLSEEAKWVAKRISIVEKEIGRLSKELQEKDKEALERKLQDSLVTARMREELDYISNSKKEDRIIITGITSRTPMPTSNEEKKKWLNEIVGEVINKIVPDSSKNIVFTSLVSRQSKAIPLVEVRFDNKETAFNIRKGFSAKKRSDENLGKIFIANSVTLATRVRVDILKAIAKKYSNEKENLSVSAFVSRPVINIRSKDGSLRLGTFNFSDALARFGAGLRSDELGEAYRRAGAAFKGQLQQNFVVLNEKGAGGAPLSLTEVRAPVGNIGSPRKRLREAGPSGSQGTSKDNNPKVFKKA